MGWGFKYLELPQLNHKLGTVAILCVLEKFLVWAWINTKQAVHLHKFKLWSMWWPRVGLAAVSKTTAPPAPAPHNRSQRLNNANCFALRIYFPVFTYVLHDLYFCTHGTLFHISKVLESALVRILTIPAQFARPSDVLEWLEGGWMVGNSPSGKESDTCLFVRSSPSNGTIYTCFFLD